MAFAGTSFCSASVAFSALYSWKKPMVALSSTTAMIAIVTLMLSCRLLPVESMAAMKTRTAATSSMIAKRLVNWSTNLKMIGRLTLAGRTFLPCLARRANASSSVRPCGEVPSAV